jgi:hypothetical protein
VGRRNAEVGNKNDREMEGEGDGENRLKKGGIETNREEDLE